MLGLTHGCQIRNGFGFKRFDASLRSRQRKAKRLPGERDESVGSSRNHVAAFDNGAALWVELACIGAVDLPDFLALMLQLELICRDVWVVDERLSL